jgi:ATP-binding cassette subfamily B protein
VPSRVLPIHGGHNGDVNATQISHATQVGFSNETPIEGEIEFRHLTFAYPTTSAGGSAGAVLHDINLEIPAGSTLAIVGPTGSGKSTLAALIARLWEAPPDTLFIDGRSIREYPLAQLRRSIGYVPQDTFLFSETVRENIAFGVLDAAE